MDDKKQSLPHLSAAMVELKAELSRKKEEFQKEKVANINVVKGRRLEKISLKKKTNIWDQKNSGVTTRAQKDCEQKEDNDDVLLQSKLILEKKSKMYDAIASSRDIPEEDENEGYLVDFQKKAVDALVEERERRRQMEKETEEEEAERKALAEPIPEPDNSDEEWVDYTDSLGRSRRCLRKDFKVIEKKDQDMANSLNQRAKGQMDESSQPRDTGDNNSLHLMSNDMYRQKMRQKWEREAQELVEKGQEQIHYSNVQYDEIRTHGVGFFQFSKDQEEREAQMEKLNQMREETKSERSRKDKIKDKRKAMMEARLAKVKERRNLKTKEMPIEEEAEIGPKLSEANLEEKEKHEEENRMKEEAEKTAEESRKAYIREWDKQKKTPGNKSPWTGDNYVEMRRHERDAEFAPPSIYYEDNISQPKSSGSKNDYGNKNFAHKQQKISFHSNKEQRYVKRSREPFQSYSGSKRFSSQSSVSLDTQTQSMAVSPRGSSPLSMAVPLDSIPLPGSPQSKSESQSTMVSPATATIIEHGVMQKQLISFSLQQMAYQSSHYAQAAVTGSQTPRMSHSPLPAVHLMQQQVSWQQQQPLPVPAPPQDLPQSSPFYDHQSHNGHAPPPACINQVHHYHHQAGQTSAQSGQSFDHSGQSQAFNYTNSNANKHTTNTYSSQSEFTSDTDYNNRSCKKRYSSHHFEFESENSEMPKKPKVPKSAIMDNRFMLNSDSTHSSELGNSSNDSNTLLNVQAIPYRPGSFTHAKFNPEILSEIDDIPTPISQEKTHITGDPMLYTAEQQQQQLQELNKDDGSGSDKNAETDEKVEEFLKSIRNEMTQ